MSLMFFLKKGNQTVTKMEIDGKNKLFKVLGVIYQQETLFSRFKTAIILKATSTKALTLRSWVKSSIKLIFFFFFFPTRKWKE